MDGIVEDAGNEMQGNEFIEQSALKKIHKSIFVEGDTQIKMHISRFIDQYAYYEMHKTLWI